MSFAEALAEARAELCVTQQRLATLLGVSYPTINRWENGFRPGPLGSVLLPLLTGAIERAGAPEVVTRLQGTDGSLLGAVRVLAELEVGRCV